MSNVSVQKLPARPSENGKNITDVRNAMTDPIFGEVEAESGETAKSVVSAVNRIVDEVNNELDNIYDKNDVDGKLALKANIDDVYGKSYMNNALAGKQGVIDADNPIAADAVDDTDSDHKFVSATDKAKWNAKADANDVYDKDAVDGKLALKANTDDVYTMAQIDGKIASVFHYKGSKSTLSEVEALTGQSTGDVWQVGDKEYVWNGTVWELLGTTVDISALAAAADLQAVSGKVAGLYDYLDVPQDAAYYAVTFMDEAGENVLDTANVFYGKNAVYTGAAQTKAPTAQYAYTFAGWALTAGGAADADALKNITADRTVYAAFAAAPRTYTVTFCGERGENTLGTATAAYGEDAAFAGSTPTKPDDATYTYTFAGWALTAGGAADADALKNITADRTVYAAFTGVQRDYTVTFLNDDNTTVLATLTVPRGEDAVYPNVDPVSTADSTRAFIDFTPAPVNVTADMTCVARYKNPYLLNSLTWAEIAEIDAAGRAADYFSVGDCKAVELNGTVGTRAFDHVTLYVYILGFDHNSAVEGTGISFGCFKTALTGGKNVALCESHYAYNSTDGSKWFNMNHSANTNSGGWKGCDMRYDILGSVEVKNQQDATSAATSSPVENTLMAALPADLRAVMKPITKYTDNVGGGTDTAANVTATVDYLPLPAEKEIFGSRTYANSTEQSHQAQYAFYANGNSKVKYNHSSTSAAVFWWGRSAYYTGINHFCSVSNNSQSYVYSAKDSIGVAPVFLVGGDRHADVQ